MLEFKLKLLSVFLMENIVLIKKSNQLKSCFVLFNSHNKSAFHFWMNSVNEENG